MLKIANSFVQPFSRSFARSFNQPFNQSFEGSRVGSFGLCAWVVRSGRSGRTHKAMSQGAGGWSVVCGRSHLVGRWWLMVCGSFRWWLVVWFMSRARGLIVCRVWSHSVGIVGGSDCSQSGRQISPQSGHNNSGLSFHNIRACKIRAVNGPKFARIALSCRVWANVRAKEKRPKMSRFAWCGLWGCQR